MELNRLFQKQPKSAISYFESIMARRFQLFKASFSAEKSLVP